MVYFHCDWLQLHKETTCVSNNAFKSFYRDSNESLIVFI